MLEILILYTLCKNLGKIARKKGYKAFGYQLMLVGLWFGSEFLAGIIGAIVLYVLYGPRADDMFFVIYLIAMACAAGSAFLSFAIVKSLPDRTQSDLDEEYKEEDEMDFERSPRRQTADEDYRR